MNIEQEIFKKCEFSNEKLIKYGFVKNNDKYIFEKNILNNEFKIIIEIKENIIKGKIIEIEFNEEYLNYRVENPIGEFVNTIKEEYIKTLEDIRNNCCINKYYFSKQANEISNLILEKYKDTPEFLWDDNDTSVFRNPINKKWYGAVMPIKKGKLEGAEDNKNELVEVINIKLPPEKIEQLINNKNYFKAYHMNKKYWISILLDGSVSNSEIMDLISQSHTYTEEVNAWVLPANPKYFDIEAYCESNKIIEWHQPKSIQEGDYAYIYIGAPISSIMYKYKVIKKDTDGFDRPGMLIEFIKKYEKGKYSFEEVKKYDLRAIRAPRRMPVKLLDKMESDEKNA